MMMMNTMVGAVVPLRPPPLHVLVVDDSDASRTVATKLLEALGMYTAQVADGWRALQHLDDHPCDLILLDVEMPLLDGYATAGRIAQRAYKPRIVAMTAHDSDDSRARCLAAGMDDTLTKPFRLSSLRELLLRHTLVAVLDEQPLRDLGAEGLMALRPALQQCLALLDGDMETIIAGGPTAFDVLHRLRGEAGMLGGRQLSHALALAEGAMRAGRGVDAVGLRSACSAFASAIRGWVNRS